MLLNLAEDHLDRHGSVEAYRAAKLRAFALQPHGGDRGRAGRADARRSAATPSASRSARAATCEHRDGRLWWRGERADRRRRHPAARRAQPRERDGRRGRVPRSRPAGRTRCAKAWPTSAACRIGSRRSPTVDGVLYVNDSKATNVASAVVGLESFAPGSVHAILGGRGKRGDYAPLAKAIAERARAVYLIGEAAAELADALAATGVPLHGLRRPRARRRRRARRGRPRRGRSALARRARRTTSTGRSRSAATTSARSSSRSARRRGIGPRVEARSDAQVRAREEAAATRAQAPADGDLLPARGRCGDGVLGLLGAHAAGGPGRRHRLPRQVRRLRRGRPRRSCTCSRATASAPRASSRR